LRKGKLTTQYRGRFAPSPSGSLHFGSLIAATASYLDAKANKGKWLLRIEDVDTPRVRDGAIQSIIHTLDTYGFEWDESILYQSQRFDAYQAALDELIAAKHVYPCSCSRKSLNKIAKFGTCGLIYPGLCRNGLHQAESQLRTQRLLTNNNAIEFYDRAKGVQSQRLESEVGDFALKRSDGIYTYQLAVVVDDAYQGITDIVRGEDLLDNTARQLYLQQLLGYSRPRYLHFPTARDKSGNKLSKQNHAPEIQVKNKRLNIHKSLAFLGQHPPDINNFDNTTDLWKWAINHWDSSDIKSNHSMSI